jgi:hypothetical protein
MLFSERFCLVREKRTKAEGFPIHNHQYVLRKAVRQSGHNFRIRAAIEAATSSESVAQPPLKKLTESGYLR